MTPCPVDERAEVCDASVRFREAGVHLDEGLEAYFEGSDLFERERFSAAGSAYTDANESFTGAHSQYETAETEVPSSFGDSFISQTCWSDALIDSSEAMGKASDAAEDGDYQAAEDYLTEATDALDVSCGGT